MRTYSPQIQGRNAKLHVNNPTKNDGNSTNTHTSDKHIYMCTKFYL